MSKQERIKKEIERDFEYCMKTNNKKDFEFYFTYCYGLVMGAGFCLKNTEELGDWWDNEMNPKFRKEIAKRS